ncbi:MAG: hypothetical protein HY606_11580 [Planctomycetes bacterium]|nr:hypothetical protein [Planctomycetota bacterium]
MKKLSLAIFVIFTSCSGGDQVVYEEYNYKQGLRYFSQFAYPQALEYFMQCVEYDRRNPNYLKAAGVCSREIGIQLYQQGYELAQSNKKEVAIRQIEEANKQHLLAYNFLMSAINVDPYNPSGYYELGVYYFDRTALPIPIPYPIDSEQRLKEREHAVLLFKKVIDMDKSSLKTYKYLGALLTEKDDVNAQVEGLNHLITYLEKRRADKKLFEDTVPTGPYMEKQKKAAIDEATQDMLKITEVLITKAIIILEKLEIEKRFDDAIQLTNKLLPHDATGYKFKTELGVMYYNNSLIKKDSTLMKTALESFESALKVNSEYLRALKHSGLIYAHLGIKLEAKNRFEVYITHVNALINKLKLDTTDSEKIRIQKLTNDRDEIQEMIKKL